MNLMVVGGGGREHAIVRALRRSPEIDTIYCLPGNAGMAGDAVCVPVASTDIPGIVDFAVKTGIDYAVIAQDDPLALGAVDALNEVGIPCFGPDKKAAQIEASKAFSKDLMEKYGIPTAGYKTFTDKDEAVAWLDGRRAPIVVKADGLALGKGVVIAQTIEEAKEAVVSMMQDGRFGESGRTVVIEEFLTGPEVTVLSFTDGKTVIPMVSSMDHKRALDGDEGLNTGGMGVIAPNPFYTKDVAEECMERIFLPTVKAMCAEGRPFKGCLYFGLMLTPDGPKVIEYNCRFGDPECQAVLSLLESDLFTIMRAVTEERLADVEVKFSAGASCCLIMASAGYPGSYEKGKKITIPENLESQVFCAGVGADESGALVTSGGRVLGVTATADTLPEAVKKAYADAEKISFDGAYYRKDIGQKAMKAMV